MELEEHRYLLRSNCKSALAEYQYAGISKNEVLSW
jgi:hypothetical protein